MTFIITAYAVISVALVLLQHKVIRTLRDDKQRFKAEIIKTMESETDVQRRVDLHHLLQATNP